MSAPAILPVRAKGTSEYTTIIVGHGSSAVTIQTLVAPSIHALLPDKAMAFDFLFDQPSRPCPRRWPESSPTTL
jgi:hypothetical protein